MITALAYRFPATHQFDAVRALMLAVALTALIAVSFVLVAMLATALTPVVVGCCSAAVTLAPKAAIVVAVFYGMWLMKP